MSHWSTKNRDQRDRASIVTSTPVIKIPADAIGIDSCIRTHRHALHTKEESLILVRGLFSLVLFAEIIEIQKIIRFGTEHSAEVVGMDVVSGIWHTIVALRPGSVLLELKAGPFNLNAAKEPAPWAPEVMTSDGVS